MAFLQSLSAAVSAQVARSAPAVLESLSRAVHRLVTQLALRIFLAVFLAAAFLSFFSESMRQLDEIGRLEANARLLGTLGLFLLSGLVILSFSVRPKSARPAATLPRPPAKVESAPPVAVSGIDVLREELRSERQAFLARWRSRMTH